MINIEMDDEFNHVATCTELPDIKIIEDSYKAAFNAVFDKIQYMRCQSPRYLYMKQFLTNKVVVYDAHEKKYLYPLPVSL